jgi:hypothetical protein
MAHDRVKALEKEDWDFFGNKLRACCTTLEQLELDFASAICPFGCCRDFNMQLDFLQILQPKIIKVLGLIPSEEEKVKKLILDAMTPPGEAAPEGLKVDINPEKDPWAKWRIAKVKKAKR